jgi:dTDP-4-amino-4,6-dideoxygalactose transaminase
VRAEPFPSRNTIDDEEKRAVARVLDSGVLSRFLGTWHSDFRGGDEVRALEEEWAARFGARHAVAVNSNTSGLYCAMGAIGIEPGDEVIVTPYSMSASAVAPLIYGGVPVFADVEPEFFCLDPASVESRIGPRTKAILVVDLFGQPYDAEAINALARRHGLTVVEDAAQAPGATLNGVPAGRLGDLGIYSLNYHKHIHCGEGGVVVTDDDDLADRVRLIRNHAESVVEGMGHRNLTNMVGFNFRMTEMEAAVARCQLRKLDGLLERRLENVAILEESLRDYPPLRPAGRRPGARHVYYAHGLLFDPAVAGVSRDRFIAAVRAELPVFAGRETEGVTLGCGYVRPLYLLPLFQDRVAIGGRGNPFSGDRRYDRGLCPTCEHLHETALVLHEFMIPSMTRADLADVVSAFEKVWEHRHLLREH